jgi:competence protein ComEC
MGAVAWWSIDRAFEPERRYVRRVTGLIPPLVAVAAFGLGAISLSAELRPRLPAGHVVRAVDSAGGRLRATVDARVVNAERTGGSGAAILVDVEALKTSTGRRRADGRMLVRVERGVVVRPAPGDRLRFTASLRFPQTFRNPGGYDARAQLALRAVRVVAAVPDYAEVTALARGGFSLRGVIERLRDRVRGALEEAARGPAAELLRALILGEGDDLPRQVRDAFQATGTYHIVSISGLHMALVAAGAFTLARWVAGWLAAWLWPAADVRRGAALAALGPVLLYMALAGAGVAAVRAALMAAAVLVALALGRRLDLWSALGLAALVLLAFYPGALFELSFLLSFGAVAAILRLSPWLADLAGIRDLLAAPRADVARPGAMGLVAQGARRAGAWVAASMGVSAAAGLGTGPLLAAAFGRLTPWAPLANLVVVPLVGGFAVALGLVGAAVALVAPAAAAPIFQADAALLDLALRAVDAIAAWPGAVVWVPTPTLWEVALAYAALWLLPTAWPGPSLALAPAPSWERRTARASVLAVVACLLVAGTVRAWPPPAGTLRVTFLDVGAGETALFELPGGERLLVDGGAAFEGAFDVGARVVTPFLHGRGVKRIDVLLLTQPRPDRHGGLAFLARVFPIGEVWLPPGAPQIGGELGRVLADRGVPIRVKRPDDPQVTFGRVGLTFLPGRTRLAFDLVFGTVAIVSPPDGPGAPAPAGWPLPVGPTATVLQWPRSVLPRYGVGPLLDTLRPQVIVVPGEPARRALRELPELLDLMEVHGSRVFLPERDGAVIVTTDGYTLQVQTVDRPGPLEEHL